MTETRTTTRTGWGELAAFGLLTALGCAAVVSSFGYGILLEGNRVGPGFLPMVLGVLLVLLGGGQLASRLRGLRPEAAETHPEPSAPAVRAVPTEPETDVLGRTQEYRVRQLWMVVGTILVTIVLVPYLGFLIGFGLMVLFITTVVERRSWLSALAITLVAVGVVYGVFVIFLHVPVPGGLLDLFARG